MSWSSASAPTARAFLELYGLLTLAPLLALISWKDLRRVLRPTLYGVAGLALVLGLVSSVIGAHSVPGPWSTNNHDFGTIAAIDHGAWDLPAGLGEVHGFAPVALLRTLRFLTGGHVDTEVLSTWVALGAVALVGLVAAAGSGRPELGIAAALLFGLHPALLRLAPTPSPFVSFVASLSAALIALEAWLVGARTRTLVLTLVCGMIALQCRGEAFGIVPATMIAWVVARRTRPWRETIPLVRLAVLLSVCAVLLVPRVQLFRSITAVTGVPMFTQASGQALVQNAQRVEPLGLVFKAASVVLLFAAVGWALRVDTRHRRWRWIAAPLIGAMVYGVYRQLPILGHDPGFLAGAFTGPAYGWERLVAIHGMTDPRLTDPLVIALTLVGAAVAAFASTAEGLLLAVCLVASLVPYVGAFDTFATVTRTSLASSATFSIAAAVALVASTGRASKLVAPALAYAVAWYALEPRLAWVSYVWPMQQEYAVLKAATDPTDPSARVMLSERDVPPGVDVATWDWTYRVYGPQYVSLSGARTISVTDALAAPDEAVGALWIRSLACVRGVFMDPVKTPGIAIDRWLIDGRSLEFSPFWLRPGNADDMSLDLALPCWREPWKQVCADDAEPCARWTCSVYDLTDALDHPGYLDPMCRAMDERFEMTPVDVHVVADGNLSGPFGVEVDPNALVGTWRITGVRKP